VTIAALEKNQACWVSVSSPPRHSATSRSGPNHANSPITSTRTARRTLTLV
jgi:hypothetical protein